MLLLITPNWMLPFETNLGLTVVNAQLCAAQPSGSKGYLEVFQTLVVLRILVSKETFDSNERRQSRGSLRYAFGYDVVVDFD